MIQTVSILEVQLEVLWHDHDLDTVKGCCDVIDILCRLGKSEEEVDMVTDAQNLLFAKLREL